MTSVLSNLHPRSGSFSFDQTTWEGKLYYTKMSLIYKYFSIAWFELQIFGAENKKKSQIYLVIIYFYYVRYINNSTSYLGFLQF